MTDEHYLKKELYDRIQSDPKLFDWIEQGSLDGLWYWDLVNQQEEWLSPRFMEVFGYAPGELPHTSEWWQAHIFEEDLPGVLENFEKHCQDPSHPYDQIVRYRHKSGATVWVRCRGLVLFDNQGTPFRMLGAHTDVTPLMQAKESLERTTEELHRSSEINRLALSVSNIGIWIWHIEEDTLYWDDGMFDLYQADKATFNPCYDEWTKRVHPDDLAEIENALTESIEKYTEFNAVFRIVWPNGEIRHIKAKGKIYSGVGGHTKQLMGANWDITEEKNREIELQRSNSELSAFAFAASHDLKAPLRSVKLLTSWIQEDLPEMSDDLTENFDTLKSRIGRMENLLDDLLTYSRIGNAQHTSAEQVECKKLIQDLFEFSNPPAGFQLRVESDLPNFECLKTPFEQVLRNLVSNAIKHRLSDEGNVCVWVEDNLHFYHFFVGDDGAPIPAEYSQKIFEMFQTLKPKDTVEGSGMGLAIAKKIVSNQGGTMELMCGDDPQSQSKLKAFNCNKAFFFSWPKTPT